MSLIGYMLAVLYTVGFSIVYLGIDAITLTFCKSPDQMQQYRYTMEEWQVQSASSIISKTFEITEYTVNSRAVRYEIAKGNLRRDFPDIVRRGYGCVPHPKI